jgi:peptidoglycan hydrolase-like protein with peptidoglycan-binding domain
MRNPVQIEGNPAEAYSAFDEYEMLDTEFSDEEWQGESSRFPRLPPRLSRYRPRPAQRPASIRRPTGPFRPRRPRRFWRPAVVVHEPTVMEPPAEGSEYVRWVQSTLNQVMNLRLPVDSIMGPETRSAIRSFQKKNGLFPDGIVGPPTEAALMATSQEQPPQAQGIAPEFEADASEWEGKVNRHSRDYIKWVQQSLNRILGLRLAIDGIAGTQTRSAIRSFQQRQGLVVDGIVGAQTEAALIAAGASSPPGSGWKNGGLAKDNRSAPASVAWDQQGVEYVKWLQRALNQVLKLKLPVTGNPDSRTISAIQRLQRNSTRRLVRIGLVGEWTERALVKAGAPSPPRSSPAAVGIDCNFDTRPYLSCIQQASWKGQRIVFAVRYYSGIRRKDLSRGEAEALSRLGIRCVTVWERRAKDANGYPNGFNHGYQAFGLAAQCGQPSGTPIYFAVDYEPSAAERAGVLRYFEGVRDGLNKARQNSQLRYDIGVYANRVGLDLCRAQGIVTWFWQSCSALTASGTNQFRWPGVALHQVACEKPLCQGCGSKRCEIKVDWNESGGHEGGWLVSPTSSAQGELEAELPGLGEGYGEVG